jgi:magnesium chelatase family protein
MRYAAKLSGPLLDRIDIRLVVRPANRAQLAIARSEAGSSAISSQQIQQNVMVARQRAAARLSGTPWTKNAQVPGVYLRKQLKLGRGVSALLDRALDAGKISMRGYDRCLRIAWTCADLAGNETPMADDLALAVYLRGPENPMASS